MRSGQGDKATRRDNHTGRKLPDAVSSAELGAVRLQRLTKARNDVEVYNLDTL